MAKDDVGFSQYQIKKNLYRQTEFVGDIMREIDKRNKIIMYLVSENKRLGGNFSSAKTEEDVIQAYENLIQT